MTKRGTRILTSESSCNETPIVVIKDGCEIENLVVATQVKSHQRFGGVVSEVADRHHTEVTMRTTKETLAETNATWDDIDTIAVTYGPSLVGALLIGINVVKAASMTTRVPLIGADHIMGHIMAVQLKDEIEYPVLTLQVSDGHTGIALIKDPIHFETVGDTRGDAAGETYNKVGRVLGVNYPASKTIDEWAYKGKDTSHFPRAIMEDGDYGFSLSGLKSVFTNTCYHADQIHEKPDKHSLAASFQALVADVPSHKTIKAVKEYKPKAFILDGSVATNHGLRDRLAEKIEELPANTEPGVTLPDLKLYGDNTTMIGVAAYGLCKVGKLSDENLNADPSFELPYADSMPK